MTFIEIRAAPTISATQPSGGVFSLLAAAAGGFWTIYSLVLVTILLLRVSGVALLEKSLKETKPDYKEYAATTNTFIPWVARKKVGG